MLQRRYVAGKWIYRSPGALIWSHSQMDAIERAKQDLAGAVLPTAVSNFTLAQTFLQ
jgi:hypothetical protein